MLKFLFSIVLCLLGYSLYSQSDNFNKRQKINYWDAETYFEYGDYLKSSQMFEELEAVDPDFLPLKYKLGRSYYELNKKDRAFERLDATKDAFPASYYFLAKIQLEQNNTNEALNLINYFLDLNPAENPTVSQIEAKKLKEEILYAREAISKPENVLIKNLGPNINTENPEYVPVITAGEDYIYFTSRRMHERNSLDPLGEPFEDIYYSKNVNGEWTEASLLPGNVNSRLHDACVGIAPSGDIMFTYRTAKNPIYGNLYQSQKEGKFWTEPELLNENINGEKSAERSASMSLDGKTIYFSSNREGGFGGYDIYRVVKLPNGIWSKARNLGPIINTPYDDEAPFIHPDGRSLYFSSKGHKTMGGYDIFRSAFLADDSWDQPQNLGYPINTTKDDIFFVITPDERHGYYSSEKERGYGDQDIYLIDYLEKSLQTSVIRCVATNAKTGDPIAVNALLIDLSTDEVAGVFLSRKRDGNFIMLFDPNTKYELMVEADGYESLLEQYSFSIEDLLNKKTIELKMNPIKNESN